MRRLYSIIYRLFLIFRSIKKIYKHGGYTIVNVAQIHYGGILKGKNVLVTGGGSGIGLAIAKKCLQEGAKVVITGRNSSKLAKAKADLDSLFLETMVWDVSELSHIDKNLERAKAILGGDIDILVNNAGVVNYLQFLDVTEEAWDSTYAINSKGLFFLTQALCDKWIKAGNGTLKKILNISSQGAFVGATYPYRMTKWDVAGLTQGLGIKLAPHNIIVNGIAPGLVQVDRQFYLQGRKDNVYMAPDYNPVERHALPEEIAELAIFLMSDASNFIVGQTIVCDGGYSIK